MSSANRKLNLIAIIGLALGAVLGLAGTVVSQANLRQVFWAIDSAGIIMATSLLTLRFFRRNNDLVAAGFLVFALGESVILSGTAAGIADSVPGFAAGTALWATALLLISIPREFAIATRVVGLAAAAIFTVTSLAIFWGAPISPITSPLPFIGYPLLVLTFVGWIWSLLKEMD